MKCGPDDVPVDVLERQVQVDQRDEPGLEDVDELLARLAIEAGGEKGDFAGCGHCVLAPWDCLSKRVVDYLLARTYPGRGRSNGEATRRSSRRKPRRATRGGEAMSSSSRLEIPERVVRVHLRTALSLTATLISVFVGALPALADAPGHHLAADRDLPRGGARSARIAVPAPRSAAHAGSRCWPRSSSCSPRSPASACCSCRRCWPRSTTSRRRCRSTSRTSRAAAGRSASSSVTTMSSSACASASSRAGRAASSSASPAARSMSPPACSPRSPRSRRSPSW